MALFVEPLWHYLFWVFHHDELKLVTDDRLEFLDIYEKNEASYVIFRGW